MSSIRLRTSAATLATIVTSIFASGTILAANQPAKTSRALPSDCEIHKILCERLGAQENNAGIIEPQCRRIISYGHRSAGDARPLNGDTVFEIGSVTKVFTSLLLADMAQKNEVALADPVAKFLPADIRILERNGHSISLIDLATHTSGLSFMPKNAPAFNDPAATKYSAADLKQYVASYQLTRDIGAQWEYSNIGYCVLSEALSSRAGMDFENLMRTRILAPLKMASTDFALSQKLKANLAPGHDSAMQPAPEVFNLPIYSIMPAAGSLYSTVNDLLILLSVAIGDEPSPLAAAMTTTVTTRRPMHSGNEQALGWTIIGKGDGQIIFRDGGSFGSASAIAFDPKNRLGVIVLSNQVGSVEDIARHLLRPDFPLAKPTNTKHTEVAIDSELLESYAGRYEAKSEGIFTVTLAGDFLTIESPADWGLPKLRLHPESPRDFFAAELPVRVTFQVDNDGRVNGLLIYPPRGQKGVPAKHL